MKDSPIVKEYSHEYQSKVVDLILHIQQQEYGISITKDDQPDLFTIEKSYQTGRGNFWVALDGNNVVGTISLLDLGNDQLGLKKMFVHKEYRGSTYKTAYRLLGHAIEWAKAHAVKKIYLGTTLQFLAAHRFYEKNGFVEIDYSDLPKSFPALQVDKKFYMYVID